MYAPQVGIAETAKAIVKHPRFSMYFFKHFLDKSPDVSESFERRTSASRAAALKTVLLAMIDSASGAPGAKRRLEALANSPERLECALSKDTETHWVASLVVSSGAINPTLSDEDNVKIKTIFETQVNHLVELINTY
ncbi:MAG: hypothetical protein ACE5FN_11920 [Leptospirillia bacterium]